MTASRASLWAAFFLACTHAQTAGVVANTRAPEGAAPWPERDIRTIRTDGSRGAFTANSPIIAAQGLHRLLMKAPRLRTTRGTRSEPGGRPERSVLWGDFGTQILATVIVSDGEGQNPRL